MEQNQLQNITDRPKRRRCQSLNSLTSEDNGIDLMIYKPDTIHRTYSDSSVELCMHCDHGRLMDSGISDSVRCDHHERLIDTGISDRMINNDMLVVMEQKIDRLSDMFLEQCRLLTAIKEEIRSSKLMLEKTELAHNQIFVDILKKAIAQRVGAVSVEECSKDDDSTVNSRAKTLLDAIEARKEMSLDSEIRASLIKFLQSEIFLLQELKEQMVRATAESVRGLIGGCFSRDMSKLYLPVLERSHRRLIAHIHMIVEQAFIELEDRSSSLFKSVYKTSGALRRALERHQCLLEATSNPGHNMINTLQSTVEELLQKELKDWRVKVTDLLSSHFHSETLESNVSDGLPDSVDFEPITPPQPAGRDVSVVDQLMEAALVNKLIEDGDVNGSFERALSAGDLSLVMVACRAVDPGQVFAAPCSLKQHVLMSLVQQLATDMLHETQLKCRFLEDAIINLDMANQDTRTHLPLVVGEVRNHLSKFLVAYPNHIASRRITMIVMAANNLLK
ncbi:unnamed protein product [Spodoptera littoralis]|uniref:Enhancer of mRNA-decapping protein 4 C-terminal domain-containing protein n=1 Tax=Spodoptera littoralis TaxID=7109 RepID=A0A9P0IEC0_SPOLI|nr:unnamed protein product [Spodoptera littoralis]CAH1645194.1 unnamed protein product [Spodoptera littoralis]